MCDDKVPISRLLHSLGWSSASGLAKASPGIAVTGFSLYGHPIEHWISVLTALYIFCMLIGSIPKACEGIRYVLRLIQPQKALYRLRQVRHNKDLRREFDRARQNEKTVGKNSDS